MEPGLQPSGSPGRPADDVEQALYAKRQKIYPREVHGVYAGLRVSAVLVLLGIFYALPWITWHGRQSVLLDLPARKFHIFGLTFWPQDFLLLAFLLIIAALSLFFFTALAGRLWCGYACPQTVWTETFLWIERMVEGDRPKQMKIDKAPWTLDKLRIKATKHLLWIVFSAYTGFTFVAYFTPARELAHKLIEISLGPWETFWLVFYGFATYGNAGWMREQVCMYMCPYARFQSAMFDDDTLVVSYDTARGVVGDDQCVVVEHRTLETRIRTHVHAYLFAHPARVAVGREPVEYEPEGLPRSERNFDQLVREFTRGREVGHERESRVCGEHDPEQVLGCLDTQLVEGPRCLVDLHLFGTIALDHALDPEKGLGPHRLRAGIAAPETARERGEEEQA